ncbi:hypothetical protein NUITMVRA1_19600 [Aerococcus viridans]|uniref:hypothetical protein n=1 Tax=Aerococcus viridans TaxID=1377 RepID=UPI0028FD4678|nr:hypothetical protein NUITMVRA1_19600 [Aerococcus viridans]
MKCSNQTLAAEHDLFFTLKQHQYEQQFIPNSELRVSPSLWGHFTGFGILQEDFDFINNNLNELLGIEV